MVEVQQLLGRAPEGPNLHGTCLEWVPTLISRAQHLTCWLSRNKIRHIIAFTGFAAGAKKDEKTFVGARVIFFVIGGMTYSEVRSAYELTKSNNREVRAYVSQAFSSMRSL